MSYDHKIIDLKFHLKGLVNQDVCSNLINFFEDNKHMACGKRVTNTLITKFKKIIAVF